MTTEREQAIRECIAATKAATSTYELVRPATIVTALESCLSAPDQAEEPTIRNFRTVAAGGDGDAGTLCERTVRACIANLTDPYHASVEGSVWVDGWNAASRKSHERLQALLPQPKPDKAKELVEAWLALVAFDKQYEVKFRNVTLAFARWLVETGRLAE